MNQLLPIVGLLAALALVAYAWRKAHALRIARERLYEEAFADEEREPASTAAARTRSALSRRRIVPWMIGIAVAAGGAFVVSPVYAATFGLIVALLAVQVELFLHRRRIARLESQLVDAIDLMVGALGAGAGATAALDAAIRESKPPLRVHLEEILGRVRYGDDPADVFRAWADRLPLETFLLFSSVLAIHWEVGGSLAPTLATVGRTIRDRIEMSRRIRSNAIQAQFSVFAVLGLTYFLAIVMWRTDPESMAKFVTSSTAAWFIAGTMLLQSLGIVWMAGISRMKF